MPKLNLVFFTFRLWLPVFVMALSACSSAPTAKEKQESYHRTQSALTYPGGDFGNISDRLLTLTLNKQLLWAQARQQCDQKPVAYQTRDPQKLRTVQQTQRDVNKNCRRTEDVISCAIYKAKLDNATEDMNDVRYEQDCYMAAPPAESVGKLQLRIVNENTGSSSYSAAPIVSTVSLTQEAKPVTLDIPNNIDGSECLALTDIQGTPVRVRNGDGDNYTFATGQMRSGKDRIALQNNIRAAQDGLQKQRTLVQDIKAQLEEEPALRRNMSANSYQCVRPAMRPLPAAPKGGLSLDEAAQQAQGYCFEKLANNFNPQLVFEYVKAAEEDQYISSYEAYLKRRNSCTRKAYEYNATDLQVMRMVSNINPRENEKRQVIDLLNRCARSVVQNCASHIIAWQSEVETIKAEPDQIYEACSDKIANFAAASKTIENMSDQINRMKAELNAYQQNPPVSDPAFVPLSMATCSAHR